MAAQGNAQKARIYGVFGATGTGKSTYIRQLLKKPRRRVLVWSPKEKKDNYAALIGGQVVRSYAEAKAIIATAGAKGAFRVVFHPSLMRKADEAQFDAVCRLLLHVENCTFIPEELHTVTSPSWAVDGWKQMVLMGRASGIEIIATSQRPAHVDKGFFGGLTVCRSGRLLFEEDAKVLAKSLMVPPRDLMQLPDMHFIERTMDGGAPVRGVVR